MTTKNIDEQIAAAERELAMRRNVYPKWVADRRMTQDKADHEIACMACVALTLRRARLFALDVGPGCRAWARKGGEADMFEYEGDWFNASLITAVLTYDADQDDENKAILMVKMYGGEVEYFYDTDEKMEAARDKFVAAWREAFQPGA